MHVRIEDRSRKVQRLHLLLFSFLCILKAEIHHVQILGSVGSKQQQISCFITLRNVSGKKQKSDSKNFIWMLRSNSKLYNSEMVPPGPRNIPFFGNVFEFIRIGDLNEMLIANAKLYGEISKTELGGRQVYFVSSPELVREVTVVRASAFRNRDTCPFSSASGGVVTAQDDEHDRFRNILNPLFLQPSMLKSYYHHIPNEAQKMVQEWENVEDMLKPQRAAMLVDSVNQVAMNILFQILFSQPFEGYSYSTEPAKKERVNVGFVKQKWRHVVDQFTRKLSVVLVAAFQMTSALKRDISFFSLVKAFTNRNRQISKQHQRMQRRIRHFIKMPLKFSKPNKSDTQVHDDSRAKDKRSGEGAGEWLSTAERLTVERIQSFIAGASHGHDILGHTMDAFARRFPRSIFSRCESDITALMKDILIAGSDTTASSISVTLWEVMNDDDIKDAVFEELSEVFGSDKLSPDYVDVEKKMPILSACAKEALRLHTSSPLLFRMANEDTQIGNFEVKKGSGIIMSTEWLGKDPLYWEHQHLFDPNRHLSLEEGSSLDGTGVNKSPDLFSYLPFGAGNHACLGSKLGFIMVVSVVATILRSVQLGVKESSSLVEQNLCIPEKKEMQGNG